MSELNDKCVKTQENVNINIVPPIPSYLRDTHFTCSLHVDIIIEGVTESLESFPELCFEFLPQSYQVFISHLLRSMAITDDVFILKWVGVYVKGSCFCNFYINIFTSGDRFIVEAMRVQGDANPFFKVFRGIMANLSSKLREVGQARDNIALNNSLMTFKSIENSSQNLCAIETEIGSFDMNLEALKSLFQMAHESHEGKLEASKLFCDMSDHTESHEVLAESGSVALIGELITYPYNECTRRNAVLTIANLSESLSCQGLIIESGVLLPLLRNCVDGPLLSLEMRRASARIIANLSARRASSVVEKVGVPLLLEWMNGISKIQDSKLKIHANRAKECFIGMPEFA